MRHNTNFSVNKVTVNCGKGYEFLSGLLFTFTVNRNDNNTAYT